jgi:hypothetical protein
MWELLLTKLKEQKKKLVVEIMKVSCYNVSQVAWLYRTGAI